MSFSAGRLLIVFFLAMLAFVVSSKLWVSIPHKDLLSILWKFTFVAAACATIGYQVRSKYTDLLEHPSLSDSEFRRLDHIVTTKRRRVTLFVLFSLFISLMLAISNLLTHLPSWALWYFKFVCTGLTIEVILFIFVLMSFGEIERFKSTLDKRKRAIEEKERLLSKLNNHET